jgi:hypothetical protein
MMLRVCSIILFALFVLPSDAFCQQDTARHGKIRLGKNKDSVYIRASVTFDVYDPGDTKMAKSYAEFVRSLKEMQKLRNSDVMEPMPVLEGFYSPFNYTEFFDREFDKTQIALISDSDTVRIRIDVRPDGKTYFKHLSDLTSISNKLVVYDAKKQGYYPATAHNMTMESLKGIKQWQAAYRMVPVRSKFKGTTVIKPVKEELAASGILTVVFSSSPFED